MFKLPSPVLLSTFFRMSFLVRDIWNAELAAEKQPRVQSNIFYLDNYNYFGIDRVGGTFSHLKSKYRDVIKPEPGLNSPDNHSDENSDNLDYESISCE